MVPSTRVTFEPVESGGARLTLTHSEYADNPQSAEARTGHLAGWEQFLTKLKDLRPE